MLVRQIADSQLAQFAYLIGCPRTGDGIVIDPERDVDRCFEVAARLKLRMSCRRRARQTDYGRVQPRQGTGGDVPVDQRTERLSMYALKAYMLPRLYWHGMLRGRA